MIYSSEVEEMMCVAKGPDHGPAPIPEEGKWVQVKEIKDISGLTHGVGWCAPQQGASKLTLNIKDGIIEAYDKGKTRFLGAKAFDEIIMKYVDDSVEEFVDNVINEIKLWAGSDSIDSEHTFDDDVSIIVADIV